MQGGCRCRYSLADLDQDGGEGSAAECPENDKDENNKNNARFAAGKKNW